MSKFRERARCTGYTLAVAICLASAWSQDRVLAAEADPAPCKDAADKVGVDDSSGSGDKTSTVIGLSSAKVDQLIQNDKLAGDQYKVRSSIVGDTINISTWINPKSTDLERDCRIDSVLMVKKLMESFPGKIKIVKVLYYDSADASRSRYLETTVVPAVVESFASGSMDPTQLLATIPLKRIGYGEGTGSVAATGTGTPTPTGAAASTLGAGLIPVPVNDPDKVLAISEGPLSVERQQILLRLRNLKAKGVGVGNFMPYFHQLDDMAKAGKQADLKVRVDWFFELLTKQENASKQAKAVKPKAVVARSDNSPKANIDPNVAKAIKEQEEAYGEFYPEMGPMYVDRAAIATRLCDMRDAGKKTDQYVYMFKEMENFAKQGNEKLLANAVNVAYQRLGMVAAAKDDKYKEAQAVVDKNKKTLGK